MRLYEYLDERRGRTINEKECRELLDTKHSKAFEGKGQIFRGVDGYGDYVYINPSKSRSPRISANTHNYYTLIMDNSPDWKQYPKRSRSLICSTDKSYADNFGDGESYSVYPQNGASIGVCPGGDIWGAGFYKGHDFGTIVDHIDDIINTNSIGVEKADYDYENMVKIFKLIDKKQEDVYVEMKRYFGSTKVFFENYLDSGKTFLGFIEYILNPIRCGFTLVKAGDSIPNGREVWMSQPCVMVKA
jgi:uncharacterized LabA/DUF88 family protein